MLLRQVPNFKFCIRSTENWKWGNWREKSLSDEPQQWWCTCQWWRGRGGSERSSSQLEACVMLWSRRKIRKCSARNYHHRLRRIGLRTNLKNKSSHVDGLQSRVADHATVVHPDKRHHYANLSDLLDFNLNANSPGRSWWSFLQWTWRDNIPGKPEVWREWVMFLSI